MTWPLVALLGLITYISRAAALALLPSLPEGVRVFLDRMPVPLFAGLAAHSLVQAGGVVVDAPTLAAAAAAVVVSPLRSLPICLVAGVIAYFAWSALAG